MFSHTTNENVFCEIVSFCLLSSHINNRMFFSVVCENNLLIFERKITLFNVTIEEIEKRWIASLPLPSPTIIETYIEDASILIEISYPTIGERLQNEQGLDKRVKIAVSQMVIRALQNPDKIRQQQETAGSFSGGVTYGKETLSGLEITEAEKRLLAPTNIPRNQKMFTLYPENFYND